MQHEHRARAVGQRRDRTVEVETGVDLGLRGRDLVGPGRPLLAESPPLLGPSLAQDGIDRQPVQPRSERGIPAESAQPLPGANEHLLRSGLRIVVIATAQPPAQPEDRAHVVAVQLLKRRDVTTLRRSDNVTAARDHEGSSGGHRGHGASWMPRVGERFESFFVFNLWAVGGIEAGMTPRLFPCLFLALLACAPGSSALAEDTAPTQQSAEDFSWSGTATAGSSIRLSNVNGNLQLVPAKGNTIQVRATKSGRDAAQAEVVVETSGDNVKIWTKLPDGKRRGSTDARVDYVVEVPAGVAFDANVVSGDIQSRGIRGPLNLEAVSGDIDTAGSGDVKVTTVSGDAKVQLPTGSRRAMLEAVNGTLELSVPASLGLDLAAKSLNGRIQSDVAHERTAKLVGSEVRISRGDRAATVRLETVNGGIEIRKG